jgi:predicted nucleic acid-binding protein
MTPVLLDTVGLIALWEENDQWHSAAVTAISSLDLNEVRLVTTPLVLIECADAASRKPCRQDVVQLRQRLLADQAVIAPTEEELNRAWDDYRAGTVGDAGVVDHVSFVLMRSLGMTDAFTNDRHFRMAGFRTLF